MGCRDKRRRCRCRTPLEASRGARAGEEFYVAGGGDDSLHTFAVVDGRWKESAKPIALGHAHGLGVNIRPMAAGVAITADGRRAVVADFENDAITAVDLAGRKVAAELDLRPGKSDAAQGGKAGGEFPYWVAVRGNDRAYVSSVRDREVVVTDLAEKPTVLARIALKGQPNKMTLNRAQTRLYVAEDNSDTLAVIDTASNQLLDELGVTAPAEMLSRLGGFRGSSPNSVLLSPDERAAYVTLGGANAVAVVRLSAEGRASDVAGLIPHRMVSDVRERESRGNDALCDERQERNRAKHRRLPRQHIVGSRCPGQMPRAK